MKTRVFAVCVVVFLFCGITHAGLSDGLVAYYPFNGNANDESGHGYNGTINGANFVSGKIDQAINFNGNSYVSYNGQFAFNNQHGDATLTFWIKTSHFNHGTVFWTRGDSPDYNRFNLYVDIAANGSSAIIFDYRSPSGALHEIGFINFSASTWTHIAFNRIGNTYSLYKNGIFVSSMTDTIPDLPNSSNWGISGWSDNRYIGIIDDTRIYSRALSASEIQQLYQGQDTCSKEVVKFTAGTPAKAVEVNANFDALNCQIQVLNSQLQALKAIVCKNDPTASVCQ